MATSLIPPPPPGFTLDAVPPPPPGFTLEGGAQATARIGPPQDLSWAERSLAPVLESIGGAVQRGKQHLPQPFAGAVDAVSNPAPIVQGMADPAIGITQLIANLFGQGGAVNPPIQEQERKYQESRGADAGSFDLSRTVASVANPLPLKAASLITPAAKLGGRVAQGGAVGAAAGAAQPVYEDDFASAKGGQIATGGTVGAVIPGAVEGAKKIVKGGYQMAEPFLPGGRDMVIGRTANKAAGTRQGAVVDALEADQRFVKGSAPTAGEAAAPAGSAEFAGLQKVNEGRDASGYLARDTAQDKARIGAVREVGKDKAALEAAKGERAANAAENYDPIRGNLIDPRAETEIMADAVKSRTDAKNVALQDKGRFDTFAAQQEVHGDNFTPVPGMPRVSPRASNFPDRVAEGKSAAADAGAVRATRGKEEKFLTDTMESLKATVGLDDKPLANFLKRPSMRKAVEKAIQGADEAQSYFPQAGEKFSVDNLQRMKMALDDIVKDPKTFGLQATEAKEITNTRDAFVRWLGSRSPEWKKARLQYAEDSVPINQMQIGQHLEKKLEPALNDAGATKAQRAEAFSAAQREAPGTIKKATGAPRYDALEEVLTPEQMQKIEGVSKDLARSANYEEMGRRGSEAARRLIGSQMDPARIPGMLERTTTIINAVLKRVQGTAEGKTLDELSKRMQEPKEMARLMRMANETERHGILASIFGAAERASAPVVAAAVTPIAKEEGGVPPRVADAPRNPKERVLGATYKTPKGNMEWSENGWLTPKK